MSQHLAVPALLVADYDEAIARYSRIGGDVMEYWPQPNPFLEPSRAQ